MKSKPVFLPDKALIVTAIQRQFASFNTTPLPVWGWLLLACLSTALLLADDFIQQWFTRANQAELELRYVFTLWLFSLGLWLARSRLLVCVVLPLLAAMQLAQLANIAFFGESLTPADLTSLFHSFGEVAETGSHHLADHWSVLLAVGLPYSLLMLLHLNIRPPAPRRARVIGLLLVLAILLAKPYRATYRDMNAFMPGPTRSALHNSLNAFAYFAVNLAGEAPVSLPPSPFQSYQLTPIPATAKHVWVVIADSLRTERLGVMGYARDTTPTLTAMQQRGDLLARPGIAAGVSTAVSLPTFINLLHEPGQHAKLRQQPYNLFRLAQMQGFRTHWLSAQESKLLNFLGSRYLDVSLTREDHPARFTREHDHALLPLLAKQPWAARNFVAINLRTAHSPYEKNYGNTRPTWPTDAALPYAVRKSNAYDNSILYLDGFLSQLIAQFNQLKGERYLLITGDHGQLLGEHGRWGHNDLVAEVAAVPVMVIARDAPPDALQTLANERFVSHYEAGVWLAGKMGIKVHNPNLRAGEHYMQGKLLLGDNHIQRITEQDGKLQFEQPQLLSQWLRHQSASTGASGATLARAP